ncbi:MAG: glutamyl-tRNA reductase [Acidobacteria bacterium]|nr:glutamyl-tRNA reductase [Acidobacteriota bacterium]
MSDSPSCPHQSVCSTAPLHFHAVARYSGLASLRAVTINHRNVGIGALPQHSVGCDTATSLHEALTAAGIESFVLATCNRTELYWRAQVPGDDESVHQAIARAVCVPDSASHLSGKAAAQHLFRVCAGLESLVLGEAEILGQVRAALDACTGAGPFLKGVVQAALRAGRMARAETAIGTGAQSVASAAVQLVAGALPLDRCRVLVLGAGATGVKAARHLRKLGVGELVVANRTLGRAEAVAAPLGAEAVALDRLRDELDRADAVVCAVDAPEYLIGLDDLRRAVSGRSGRPLMIVDLSMPHVVEPGDVAGVTRVDLGVLEREVERHRDRRAAEVPKVEGLIDREMHHLQSWARHHALRPLASDLRRKVEAIRRAELERAQHELPEGGAADAAVLDRLTRRLLDQVLAIPLATLEAGDVPLDATQAQYLRRLFALEPGAASWP